ncbi:MAG: hypothetical protein A2Y25_09310 [Candidatus Melainabacteria bacterium GWF2_37_15]|nr:MAG: hypothetical protein A2Y25_09310 [Candidatus Melainabacteria bacterium GWF2_37_15]
MSLSINRVGIQQANFSNSRKVGFGSQEDKDRIKQLEQENAELKQKNAELQKELDAINAKKIEEDRKFWAGMRKIGGSHCQ